MRFIPAVSPVRIQSPLPSTGETRERLAGHPLSKQRRPVGQVVKTRPFHGCNMGSSPVRVTTSAIRKRDCRINGGLAQLVRAPASHAGGHWFESSRLHQKVPDFARNQELFLFILLNSDAAFWRFSLDPNRDPKAERSGKRRRGADGIIRPSPAVFCGLHGLTDDTADGIGGTRGLTQAAHRVRRWKAASPSPCRAPAHLPSETADNSSCCRTGGRVYTFITMNTYRLLQKWSPTEVRFGTPHR